MRKTVLITGSSRGIGAQTARKFAENGYNVIINYKNSKQEALELLDEIRNKGVESIALKADVSNFQEAQDLVTKSLEEFGHLDVLVNNAGIACQKLFTDISHEEWTHMFNVNIHSMFNCTKPVVENMLKRHSGKIINISSVWGITGGACEVHYSASKAAVIGFTKSLAKELGPSNIQVNCVAPGFIETDMNKNLNLKESEIEDIKKETPCMRLGNVKDVSEAVFFLAGEGANFITGQVIGVNGGILI